MTLPQFDPALGTLTGVSWVDVIDQQGYDHTSTNNSATETADFGAAYSRTGIDLAIPAQATEFPILSSGNGVGTAFFSFASVLPGDTTGVGLEPLALLPFNSGAIDAGLFPSYTGLGTLTATRNSSTGVEISNLSLTDPNDLVTSGFGTTTWTRTITYEFDAAVNNNAVPEPITAGLGLMGLAALGYTTTARNRRRVA